MRLKSAFAAGLAAALIASSAQAAGVFVNGSFEDGFTGWVTDENQVQLPGAAVHRDEFGVPTAMYDPIDGFFMAAMQAYDTDTPVLLHQTFTTVGGVFSGSAAFLGEDFLPWNDNGYVRIFRLADSELESLDVGPEGTELFAASIASVGDWSATPWTFFSVHLEAGTYRIEAGVTDINDDREPSLLILDNFVMAEVPEPATWALMLTGFVGLGAMLRRRRAAAA